MNTLSSLSQLLPDIYKDLAQPSLQVLGNALGKAVEFATLPITALGTVSDCAKANLNHRLVEYTKKVEQIPEDKRVEVHPQIAVPIIQKLSYATNDEIANLFTNLLTTASNSDTSCNAHPGFESIISQLSPDEARIIQFLKSKTDIPYCSLKVYIAKSKGYIMLIENASMIPYKIHLEFQQNINAYYANMIRLGIILDMKSVFLIDDNPYNEIKEAYNFAQYDNLVPGHFSRIELVKSHFNITQYGRLFINACTNK